MTYGSNTYGTVPYGGNIAGLVLLPPPMASGARMALVLDETRTTRVPVQTRTALVE